MKRVIIFTEQILSYIIFEKYERYFYLIIFYVPTE